MKPALIKDFESSANASRGLALWHVLAIGTIAFWGTSFVSTKVLLNHGFSAVQIFTLRFTVTYLLLLAVTHKKFRCENWKHELVLCLCGLTGCTLYFWAENTALTISPSSNVSLIVCTNPLLTMIFGGLIYKRDGACCVEWKVYSEAFAGWRFARVQLGVHVDDLFFDCASAE